MAEDSQQHRRAAAPSVARGPGGDRRARRRPQAVGDGERRLHLRAAREPLHRRPGEHLHAHAARDRVARPRLALGNRARAGAAQARSRRARSDRRLPHHLGRLRRHREKARREARFEGARAPRDLRHVQVHVERGHHRLPVQVARQNDVPLSSERQPSARGERQREEKLRQMMTCSRKVVIFAIGARKSAYALLFLTASLLSACSGGGQESAGVATIPTAGPGDVEKFFQLTPGNRWGFNVTVNETGHPTTSGFETVAVTGTKTISGLSTVVLSYSGQGNAEEYYLKNNAGLFYFGDNSTDPVIAAISPYQVFRFPLQPIDTFVQVDKAGIDFGADLDGDGRNETIAIYSTVTVVGFETVTVPAGTFNDCARIETDIAETLTLSKSGTTLRATGVSPEWYAPGIGPVKKHSEHSGSGYTQSFDYALASYMVDGRKSDTTPPAITSVQPSPGGVLVTAQIQAVFSEEIDPLSLNATSFAVRNAANQQVAGTISYANKTAAFTPPAPLAAG